LNEPIEPIPSPHLRALSKRIERMREEERTRIARELHDELGQLLTGIKLDFSVALRRLREVRPPGDVVDRLQSAIGQIDIAIATVRRIAGDLRPPLLDHRDLGGAIEHEARTVAARAGVMIQVSNRVTGNIDPDLATTVFRIFQEALTNAVRHAHATAISARISTSRGRLQLHVRDNGIGISGERMAATESLGLLGMHERAHGVGAELRIRGRPGRGTLVSLLVPLPE
jgi:signal transduction histidine kinase